jgi:hypothetical protein
MLALPLKMNAETIFSPFLEWCYERVRGRLLPLDREHLAPIVVGPESPDTGGDDRQSDFAAYYDASLLFRSMVRLQIDRDQLADDDPLLFRELQGRCTLCQSKAQCAQELTADPNKVGWEKWENYCPNARTLMILGACRTAVWPRSISDGRARPSDACARMARSH